jgi:hypothetical protein
MCWQNSVLIASNVASTMPLSVGVPGRQFCTETPSRAQARVNVSDTNTFPPSMTMVSGTITGLAAANAIRASTSTSRACGNRDADIRNAADQPGRIGSGTSIRASSNAASTAFVPTGRSTAAQIVLVATSTAIVKSARTGIPDSSNTITSIGVESICTCSPGRAANVGVNAPPGRFAVCRRVTADPNVCRPVDNASITL